MSFSPDGPVEEEELLYRSVHPSQWSERKSRPSSAAFKQSNGTSVDRDGDRDEEKVALVFDSRESKQGYGLSVVKTYICYDADAYVAAEPIEGNPYHAGIYKNQHEDPVTKGQARRMAKQCNTIWKPGEPCPYDTEA